MSNSKGFSLIEVLVVVAIIGILASVVLVSVGKARSKAYEVRAKAEFREIAIALEEYANDNGGSYPADVTRGLPNGIEKYLAGGIWPPAPWPNTLYDWDNWTPANLTANPKEQVYQISIRFCPDANSPVTDCYFPDESWVDSSWDAHSSVYYCISGPCRAHSSELVTHPGNCIGGRCPD